MNRKMIKYLIFGSLVLLMTVAGCQSSGVSANAATERAFDGSHAFNYAETLMSFGPRIPGSSASHETLEYIRSELQGSGWQVEIQSFDHKGVTLNNIVAYQNPQDARVLIGAHYDTRAISDQESDPALQELPVPGANDGTSGTAVLLELARSLQNSNSDVCLVFFDGEDQGHINDWDWSVGAQYFANHLKVTPQDVIVIDMIGDADLNVYREKQSDQDLCDGIWNTAQQLGLGGSIINQEKYAMLDDHLPFIKLGIPSCLMIDFDYPYWHTQGDTLEHISAKSLQTIGDVLLNWISTNNAE
jgi:Iap family predicted aminopeptidase